MHITEYTIYMHTRVLQYRVTYPKICVWYFGECLKKFFMGN